MLKVEKRNGAIVKFEGDKIVKAISKAMAETDIGVDESLSEEIADRAFNSFKSLDIVNIEKIQDFVEIELMRARPDVAKNIFYIGMKELGLENMVGK